MAILRSKGYWVQASLLITGDLLDLPMNRPHIPSSAFCLKELHKVPELQLFLKEILIQCMHVFLGYLLVVMIEVMVICGPSPKRGSCSESEPVSCSIRSLCFLPLLRFDYGCLSEFCESRQLFS